MTRYQPFVGEHAEYYRRRTLRDVTSSAVRQEPVILENKYLRQEIVELEAQVASYKALVGLLERPPHDGGLIRRLIRWFRSAIGR